MKRRHGAVRFAPVLSVLVVVAVMAVAATVMMVRVANAIPFELTLTAELSDYTAGAKADFTTHFGVPDHDAQFQYQATFIPVAFNPTKGTDMPLGAIVGALSSKATLSILNTPCNVLLNVVEDSTQPPTVAGKGLMNATIDMSSTVTYSAQFDDLDGNGLPDGADKYPDYVIRMFPGLTPLARFYGQATVGGTPSSINFVFFAPGSTLPGLGTLDPSWGIPSVSVVDARGDPGVEAVPLGATGFCTPLTTVNLTYAVTKDNPDTPGVDESGVTIMSNPTTAGTYTFRSRGIANQDADDDNIENLLDTCPFQKNAGVPWEAKSGDQDGDGLDDVCDPDPTSANSDQDKDGFSNRQDRCPLVANPDQKDSDVDSIGDVCDTVGAGGIGKGPDVADGAPAPDFTVESSVTITGGAVATATAAPATATAAPATVAPTTAAATATKTATATTAAATATATKTATVTVVATPTKVTTPVTTGTGGGGLLQDEEGFPTWAFFLIGIAAVLLLGGLGTAVTVTRRRNK